MAEEQEQEQPLAGEITVKSGAKGELTVEKRKQPEPEEETAGIRAFGGKPETCSNCRHEFQLQCQLGGMGKLKPVDPNGHCNSWE